jgi:hypothetical protein
MFPYISSEDALAVNCEQRMDDLLYYKIGQLIPEINYEIFVHDRQS